MAKKEESTNYGALLSELKARGPQRLYLLWGPEDYLREQFLAALKKACLPEGEDDFSYKRLNGPELDALQLRNAMDSVPFLSERTLVEVCGADLNRIKEHAAETIGALLADVPDYCTVVFVQDSSYEPDGRLKLVRSIKKFGRDLKFTAQQESSLVTWVQKRFAAAGKTIDADAARHLIFVSGTLMNRLIPEIDKLSAYAAGERVTREDIEAVASHIPEARAFEMTDRLAARDNDAAARILAELLADSDNDPIPLLAVLGGQMRRLYVARLAQEQGLGRKFVADYSGVKFDFLVDKLMTAARGFTLPRLRRAVELCCETDYAMKSTGADNAALLTDALLRIAAGET